jgi:heme exporter protein C
LHWNENKSFTTAARRHGEKDVFDLRFAAVSPWLTRFCLMNNRLINWFKFASPQSFYPLAGKMIPWFAALAVVFGLAGLWLGMVVAPTDFQQGEGYRIIFIHVPASWMSMFIYLVMAFWAALGLAYNTRLSGMMAQALAPTGALMAFLSLWTGALWGKPMWGTWWVWDARLTSELILLFLYIGFIALQASIDDPRRADKAGAVLALVGVVNIPIIYFSVKWWNTLHQGSSVSLTKSPSMAMLMLWGMLLMALSFWMYSIAIALYRARCIMLERERGTEWVKEVLAAEGEGAAK